MMMFDFLSGPSNRIQTTRLLLLAIIVLTIPCYCVGAVMLAYAPESDNDPTAIPTNSTLGGVTQQPLTTATNTPFATWTRTPTQFGVPLGSTPGQLYLPTNTPYFIPATVTPFPTWTGVPTLTSAPTLTPVPSATLKPTNTAAPTPTNTAVPAPTNTEVPVPTNTAVPVPTNTTAPVPTDPPPTDPPVPTQEVLQPNAPADDNGAN